MVKALFKKQFLELNSFYLIDRKTGKTKPMYQIIGYILLLVFVIGMLEFYIYGNTYSLANFLESEGKGYLFYAIMSILSVLVGVFGSVFSTSATLYKAKDNDLLLSMPIKPVYILIMRLIGVFITTILFTAILWIPTFVAYSFGTKSVSTLFPSFLGFVFVVLIAMVLTCFLGWIFTIIGNKINNKNFIKVVLTLAFLTVYYVFYFRLEKYVESIMNNMDKVDEVMNKYLLLSVILGKGCTGDYKSLAIFALFSVVAITVCLYVLSKSFISIVTSNHGEGKVKYVRKAGKSIGIRGQLLKKELKRFVNCSSYMLNCGLGLILLPGLAIYSSIQSGKILDALNTVEFDIDVPDFIHSFSVIMLIGAAMLIVSMNVISAPSVSLEGKNIWILHTLPLDTKQVLSSKILFHTLMNYAAVVISVIPMEIAFKLNVLDIITSLLILLIFCWVTGIIGLFFNLLLPNLEWSNEVEPIKRGLSVIFSMFAGWLLTAVILGGAFIGVFIGVPVALLIESVVLFAVGYGIRLYIMNRGVKIFDSL